MCGIIGYVGRRKAAPILLEGLSRLEYRGYDSAGIAVLQNNKINIKKAGGRLAVLRDMTAGGNNVPGCIGIGHTRWATHGKPSDINSHPHISRSGRFAVVHNGIIENYIPLKNKLIQKGFEFVSETDTEVIAHLLEYYYKNDIIEAVIKVIAHLKGSYALGILCAEQPDSLIAVKKSSPMVVGLGKDENYIASDVTAILSHTRRVCYLDDDEIVVLKKDSVKIYNIDREEITKEPCFIEWDTAAAEKGGYEHFMMKEIEEQPKAFRDTISARIRNEEIVFDELSLSDDYIKNINKIFIIACGSSYHVGMVSKYMIEKHCRIPVEVVLASEFRYCEPLVSSNDLCIVISQSGETADTLAALKEARALGAKTLSIVNVVGSSIANESDYCIYTLAGPEIAVATTKAYSTQLAIMYLLTIYFAKRRGVKDSAECHLLIKQLQSIPEAMSEILTQKDKIQFCASRFFNCHSIFFIGRNIDYAMALEGSLKLKEISYIHSEAYAAGELKHGTISLIENGTLVVALATNKGLYEKTLSNIKEVKARGAVVLGITTSDMPGKKDIGDYIIELPVVNEMFIPSLSVIELQLFGYYIAALKGCDIDKPRNLAKSVTVE